MIIGLIIIAVLIFTVWVVWDNKRIVVTTVEIKSERLPESFTGYRVAHVTDLHNDEFGEHNAYLLETIRAAEPDMIVITGDLLDSRRTDEEKAANFVRQAVKIAPCYYVTGNHESRMTKELQLPKHSDFFSAVKRTKNDSLQKSKTKEAYEGNNNLINDNTVKEWAYDRLEKAMIEAGAVVLRNAEVLLEKDGESITLIGIDDPRFFLASDKREKMENALESVLEELFAEVPEEQFTLLLAHRPELFELYSSYGPDLVLSGHVHGGQFRIPGIGGIVGPGQGVLPDYDAGIYSRGNTKMVLSRGLGQSSFPFRLNNPPELVVVELQSAERE